MIMSASDDENISTLLSMGFPDIDEIKKALVASKNDLTEAVSLLTSSEDIDMRLEGDISSESFPLRSLKELETRVFQDNWTIPYKKEESFAKCLSACVSLPDDPHAKRFLERVMPEAFNKLLTSPAVNRWEPEVQAGIFDMTRIFMDILLATLAHSPASEPPLIILLETLRTIFDLENDWNNKNRDQECAPHTNDSPYVRPGPEHGWIRDLLAAFGEGKGFTALADYFKRPDKTARVMQGFLAPLAGCCSLISDSAGLNYLQGAAEEAFAYVKDISDFRSKDIGFVSDLLCSLKKLCARFWAPSQVELCDSLRLSAVLRMLKTPFFNSRMNALKEVSRLIEESRDERKKRTRIEGYAIAEWMSSNCVLSAAFEGNIDQVQYTDRIRAIVEFLGPELSTEELSKIWAIQETSPTVQENVFSILGSAANKFSLSQLEHLTGLIKAKWEEDSNNDRVREKLLAFIGQIGKDAKQNKSTSAILSLLWNVSHYSATPISKHVMEKAMSEHLNILNDVTSHREALRRKYIFACIEDIKDHSPCLLSSVKQLHELCKSKAGAYHNQKAEKSTLLELNKDHEVVRLLTESLCYSHGLSVRTCSPLRVDSLVDGRYTHTEYMHVHLEVMAFFLKEGVLYLSWSHCEELWNTLVNNPSAIQSDKDTFFNWIQMCLLDLERETQVNFFTQNLLKMDPATVDDNFFNCFKEFFQIVNVIENLLSKKSLSSHFVVEELELVGLDYFWQIIMHCELEDIASKAIDYLLNMSYHHVAPNLKRNPVVLHEKFIGKCYEMLDNIFSVPERKQDAVLEGCELETSVRSEDVNDETTSRTLTSISVSKVSSLVLHAKGLKLQKIRRIIHLAERYISSIEETYNINRTILPHAASFHGRRIKIKVTNEAEKEEEQQLVIRSHTNETVGSLKRRIAMSLNKSVDSYSFSCGDVSLSCIKDHCFIGMMDAADKSEEDDDLEVYSWSIKPAASREVLFSCPEEPEVIVDEAGKEVEKNIPGVVMASGGHIFPMLYKLATLRVGDSDKRMMTGLRRLIHLIPTDPDVSNLIDSFVSENYVSAASPKFSMRKFDPKNLSDLFDASIEGMSPFRVLYNLEILSSKLMPTRLGQGPQSRLFAKDFLKTDGVKLILGVVDTLPSDVDYDLRQSVFLVVLQLTAFLLCGQASPEISTLPTPPKKSQPTLLHNFSLRTMSEASFQNTLSRLMKIVWAASAGKLNLASSSLMNRATVSDNVLYSRSRESSTGSSSSEDNASSSSSSSFGIACVSTAKFVGVLDAQIAGDAFELLVTSLSLRIHEISLFYNLPLVDEFIVDTVLGSPSKSVRAKARDQLIRFSRIPYVRRKIFSAEGAESSSPIPSPKSFLTRILLKTPVPLWMPSCKARGTSHIILSQCTEYFELRCSLLRGLGHEEQEALLAESAASMLDDELSFLYNYTPCHRLSDCNLLAGHLQLVEALLTCDGVDKAAIGREIIREVLNSFLFPASRIITEQEDSGGSVGMNPKCDTVDSRISAYQLLIELSRNTPANLRIISEELISLHHQSHHLGGKDFDYEPDVERRRDFVGLKNAGATCYMNSVLQQLYSIPGVADDILGETVEQEGGEEQEGSIFRQLQVVFGYLLESKLKYYSPEDFWKAFKLFGRPVNVREQQDAFEFFTQIVSQVDESLSAHKRPKIFAPRLEGLFSDQKVCQGCPHRYEREQVFTALNLPVTTNNLSDSLDQFVKGELLEGDNAYYCEKCGTKRNAIKRMCIRSCPSTLVIQLKRFHYDWESNRALKFDDYFQFPLRLDMGPYTADGIRMKGKKKAASLPYDLCGVVVHSGQASAGHYYSFVRKRKSNGKWYKFNDTSVEEFDVNEETLSTECFGGNYTDKKVPHLPEERVRYWNAYMLFYEARKPAKRLPKKKSSSFRNNSSSAVRFSSLSASLGSSAPLSAPPLTRESFSHLNDLLEHGERSGLFDQSLKMPNSIERSIREKNLKFLRDRDLFCSEYYKFVLDLIKVNPFEVQSTKLSVHFLFNGYLHLKLRDSDLIQELINIILSQSSDSDSSLWLLEYLANTQQLFRLYLLECPAKSVRRHFSDIVYHVLSSSTPQAGPFRKEILSTLACLVDQDASNHAKDSKLLFWLLWKYSQLGLEQCQELFESGTFRYAVKFLLGMDPLEKNLCVIITRKWTSSQIREFSEIHSLIAFLITICDASPFITTTSSSSPPGLRASSPGKLPMPDVVQATLYGELAPMYVREVVTAVRENIVDLDHLFKMLLASSYACERFTCIILEELLKQYSNVNSSELKHLSNLIIELLAMEDLLQFQRIKTIVDGGGRKGCSEGLLSLIPLHRDSDSRRAYQCIKTLVNAANRSLPVKSFLLTEDVAEKWEESVRWLQGRMADLTGAHRPEQQQPISVLPSSSSVVVSSSEPLCDIFSNEDSSTRTFRRTTSAQVTLEEANALMAHCCSSSSNMEIEEELMKTDDDE